VPLLAASGATYCIMSLNGKPHPAADRPASHAAWVRRALGEYEGPLVRYARSITGDLEAARDCVQETFLRLCRAEVAQVDGRLAAWLFSVCRNQALDVLRKENRMSTLTLAHEEQLAARDAEPAAAAERGDTTDSVHARLALLPENQQEVIRLKFQSELSYKEIAGVTGLTVSNVGFLIHRGLKTLRAQLAVE
jgi:RNA polymerase sigma-70 factor (ECF subfamily)